ncbi:MAG: FtsQ-type POTRA domain-containing protein [Anaerolineales bacterium]
MSEKRETSRAEAVRARRAQRSAKEIKQTTQRAVKPIAPVSSRVGVSYVREKHKPAVTANRRRFNVAIGLPNIALHRPAITISRPSANWRTASLGLAIFFAITIYLMWTLSYFHVNTATVLGNSRLSKEEINAVLGVTGQSIFLIQPEDVATRLRLNYPELASAKVNVYLPNHVYVTVTERQPVILWQQDQGFTWIDATGVAFRPRGDAGMLIPVLGLATPPAGSAPLDDPLGPPPYMQKELVEAILALAPSVPAGSTLTFNPADGLGWKDSRGWEVFFGTNPQDMPLKIRVYQSLVDSLTSRGRIPEYINVAFPSAPYYRMSKFTSESTSSSESGQP